MGGLIHNLWCLVTEPHHISSVRKINIGERAFRELSPFSTSCCVLIKMQGKGVNRRTQNLVFHPVDSAHANGCPGQISTSVCDIRKFGKPSNLKDIHHSEFTQITSKVNKQTPRLLIMTLRKFESGFLLFLWDFWSNSEVSNDSSRMMSHHVLGITLSCLGSQECREACLRSANVFRQKINLFLNV